MKYFFVSAFFIVLTFCAYQIISASNEKQQLRYEQAELNSIKYGLFDVDQWKDQIAEIIVKKIDEYEITSENKEYIKGHIEAGFYRLFHELELYIEKGKESSDFLKWATFNIVGTVSDIINLKSQVPHWADEVMKLIENPNTQHQLKDHLKNRIVQLINESKSLNEKKVLNNILAKHHFDTNQIDNCDKYLQSKIDILTTKITIYTVVSILLCLVVFLLPLITSAEIENIIVLKVVTLLFLLILGISIPMLSIDVRIDKFEFLLLGEKINFENQTLYFQSKSILHVIKVLLLSMKFKSVITGILIFLFSVVFPFTKLFSILYESFKQEQNAFTDFFVNKSGKWSMADVMVVAVFLAFLGINSFLNDLLKLSESTSEFIKIIPNNNHSALEIGIVFFIGYVILALLTKPFGTVKDNTSFGRTF